MKVGNVEVPDGIKLVISFPGLSQEEINKIKEVFKASPNSQTFLIGAKIKVLAQTSEIIVLEATT